MNTRSYFFPIVLLMVGVLGLLTFGRVLGAPPRLGSPIVLSSRVVELSLTGQVGAAYSIEASSNLSNWFLVSGGIATNGLLTIRHDNASNYPALFYRGKGADDSLPPLTVSLKTDTNISVSTLVSLDGGAAVLYGRDGTRFTLSLPSNSIPDASIITMTLVTNITGLPFARGTLGTVALEPADLAFWGAASLEIMFPSNINRREVISYFTKGDGSGFHLTPDRVSTNRIMIPVTRLGTFGSSLATTQELATAARIGTGSAQPPGLALASKRGGIGRQGSSTSECFPEKQLAADEAKRQIDSARDAKSKEIAALLGVERQKQIGGESDDSSAVLVRVADELCAFYTSQIAPRWAAATDNCALGNVLIVNTLGLERQRELLGASDDCTALSTIPFCAIFKSCLQDTRDCCARGKKGPARVAEVLGLQRQDQLLGLDCISYDEAQEVIDLCSSNLWTGTFSMIGTGSRVTPQEVPPPSTGVTTDISEFTASFEGTIEESQETGFPEVGFLVELRVVGQLVQREFHKVASEYSNPAQLCLDGKTIGVPHRVQLDQSEHITATNTTYSVSFVIMPGSSGYLLFTANDIDPVMGRESVINYQSDDSACVGKIISKDFTLTLPGPDYADSLPDASGSMSETNVVSGSFSMDDPLRDPPRHIEFKWNFTRHGAAP